LFLDKGCPQECIRGHYFLQAIQAEKRETQDISPLYVTKSVIDSRAVWGIICLLFLVKNRKEAEDGPGGFFRKDKSASISTRSCEGSFALSAEPQSDKRDI
jgi:hypothetical protein